MTADNKSWFYDIQKYLMERIYPEKAIKKDKAVIRQLALKFTSHQGVLYRRTSNGMQLSCLSERESTRVMKKVHEGVYSLHMNGAIPAKKLMTIMKDCNKFVRKCHKCQIHGDVSHLPLIELHSISSPWPFSL